MTDYKVYFEDGTCKAIKADGYQINGEKCVQFYEYASDDDKQHGLPVVPTGYFTEIISVEVAEHAEP